MKAAVYFATGFEEVEALAPVDILRRGKVEVVMVGVSGKTVVSARNISVNMDTTIEEFDYNTVDMIVIPGGIPGVPNLEANEKVLESVKAFKKEGKWIAAICAGPSLLGKAELLAGEKATCYPGYEEFLLGAEHTGERVVRSGKVITGIGAGASLEFGYELLSALQGNEAAEKVRKGMIAL